MDKVVFIDANIFLEIALKDIKSEECKRLIKEIILGNIKGFTSDFIIYSCLLQIHYKTKELSKMKDFIMFINNIPNLDIMRASFLEITNAVNFMKEYKLDFDDSLIISLMVNNNIQELASLDKDFDKVKIIKKMQL